MITCRWDTLRFIGPPLWVYERLTQLAKVCWALFLSFLLSTLFIDQCPFRSQWNCVYNIARCDDTLYNYSTPDHIYNDWEASTGGLRPCPRDLLKVTPHRGIEVFHEQIPYQLRHSRSHPTPATQHIWLSHGPTSILKPTSMRITRTIYRMLGCNSTSFIRIFTHCFRRMLWPVGWMDLQEIFQVSYYYIIILLKRSQFLRL